MGGSIARCILSFAILAGTAHGQAVAPAAKLLPDSQRALNVVLNRYPGVRVVREGDRVTALGGRAFGPIAKTPELAAEAWIAAHIKALGVGAPELVLERVDEVSRGRFTILVYSQEMNGLPVEDARLRITVTNAHPQVVLVTSTLAAAPEEGLSAPAIPEKLVPSLATAWASADSRRVKLSATLSDATWSEPQLIAWRGENGIGRTAWRIEADAPEGGSTFVIDAATGELLADRPHRADYSISGTVRMNVIGGTTASGPIAEVPAESLRASILPGGAIGAYTARGGAFSLEPASTPSTVQACIQLGQYAQVSSNSAWPLNCCAQATLNDGENTALFINPDPDYATTAATTAYYHVTGTHHFIRDRAPTYAGLEFMLPVRVNEAPCTAYYQGGASPQLTFSRQEGACPGTAFSTIISHEYGHFFLDRLGIINGNGFGSPNAFAEGFCDTLSELVHDTPCLGTGWIERCAGNNTLSYPCACTNQCTGEQTYACGDMLAGMFWDLRTSLGLEFARQMFVDFALITSGGEWLYSSNALHARTALEILTLDDENANLNDGTPHNAAICAAFTSRNIQCGVFAPPTRLISQPSPTPAFVRPMESGTINVSVTPPPTGPAPTHLSYYMYWGNTASLPQYLRLNTDRPTPVPYPATLPFGASVHVNISVGIGEDEETFQAMDYLSFTAEAAWPGRRLYSTSFADAGGWMTGSNGVLPGLITASGAFRLTNLPLAALNAPTTDVDGSRRCFVAGPLFGGTTILTSPTVALPANIPYPTVQLAHWWKSSGSPGQLRISAMGDNGVTAALAAYPIDSRGWAFERLRIPSTLTGSVSVRIVANDPAPNAAGSTFAAVDAFAIIGRRRCPADFTDDGAITQADRDRFLALYAQRNPEADINADGKVTQADIAFFEQRFAGGC